VSRSDQKNKLRITNLNKINIKYILIEECLRIFLAKAMSKLMRANANKIIQLMAPKKQMRRILPVLRGNSMSF
jgi:hypothetical protein